MSHHRFPVLLIAVLLTGCALTTPRIVRETVIVTQSPWPTYTPYPTYTPPSRSTQVQTISPTATVTTVPAEMPTPTSEPDCRVNVKALNLRAGPDTSYDQVGVLHEEDALDVTARTAAGDWLAVIASDGSEGWVFAAYVTLNIPLDDVPVAAEVPATPTPSGPTPTPLPVVDAEIEKIARGEHGELSQPSEVGHVAANGEAEVTIVNDTPYELTILVGMPNSTSITVEACGVCKVYSIVGPVFCPTEGRPQRVVRLKPGTFKVAASVGDASVTPFLGTWELKGDTGYFNCFYILKKWQ